MCIAMKNIDRLSNLISNEQERGSVIPNINGAASNNTIESERESENGERN